MLAMRLKHLQTCLKYLKRVLNIINVFSTLAVRLKLLKGVLNIKNVFD